MDRFNEADLKLHAINGRGEKTQVIFSRVGDPVPLEPIYVNVCPYVHCTHDLSAALWSRDVQYEIADHLFNSFDKCGLPPIAIPEINLPWVKAQSHDQRPVGRIFDLRAKVLLDAADIDDDVSRFQEGAEACVRTLMQEPTENPGWALITNNVGFEITSLPLLSAIERPAVRPVLEEGPYASKRDGDSAIKNYGRTVHYHLIIDGDQTIKSLLTTSEHPALADHEIRVALKQPLTAWLREVEPDRTTSGFLFKASNLQEVPGSDEMGRMFIEITDPTTSETAVVVASISFEAVEQEARQPLGFELVVEFGRESVLDVPPTHFDLEQLPNE
ncbi:hypothetical protein [uncultured Tateyamaria sp.]|uniref:hypothetical protein n=1 Tax=uncultured Tateyamaria sp. TaxID=455651 RepID=UPI00260C9119|nr:hypothetical protein [uncultured Tateyamaria sp.]